MAIYHRCILRHIRAIACVLSSFWLIGTACAGTDILTADERNWLTHNQSRIVLGVETGYAPFVFLDDQGRPAGLAQDYIRLIETKIGVSFKEKQFSSLKDIFEQVHAGEVHVVNAVTKTPARSQFLTFTAPFVSVPNVILVRKDRAGQMSEKTLSGLTVSLVKSYAVTEDLANKNLGFAPDLVADDITALLNVSFGRSDAAVIDLATASYLISTKGITNLRVAGETELDIRLAIGTPISESVLNRILQKGLAAITEAERKSIHDKWISTSSPSIFTDWRLWLAVGIVLASILVAITAISIWNRTLRRQVLERTADLEKERANLEQRVLERTADLTRAQSVGQIGSWILNVPGGHLTWSDQTYRIFGIEIGKPLTLESFFACIHPDDRGWVSAAWNQALTGTPYDIEHRILRGEEVRWVRERAELEFAADGSLARGIGTVQDITDRKRADAIIAASQNMLNEAQHIAHLGSWEWNLVTDELSWSDEAAEILVPDNKEAIPSFELFLHSLHPDDRDRVQRAVKESIEQNNLYDIEYRMVSKAKGEKYVHAQGKVFRRDDGKAIRFVGTVLDITDRKLIEQELQRSNTELEQFSYSISHDMRQPLRMITSHLQLIEKSIGNQLDVDQRENFHYAIDGAKRLDKMLVSLLEYSRVGRKGEPPTWVESHALLDEALLFLQSAIAEAQAELHINGAWPRIFVSPDEISRLLQNLISNAVKYRVAERKPIITVTSELAGNQWHLSVADNGIGILPDQIGRLFQVFQRLQSRTAYEGTGIGLALCRKIAEHHGGSIRAESTGEGQGSCFRLYIPIKQDGSI